MCYDSNPKDSIYHVACQAQSLSLPATSYTLPPDLHTFLALDLLRIPRCLQLPNRLLFELRLLALPTNHSFSGRNAVRIIHCRSNDTRHLATSVLDSAPPGKANKVSALVYRRYTSGAFLSMTNCIRITHANELKPVDLSVSGRNSLSRW